MTARQRLLTQLREALQRGGRPASRPEDVACCGHDQGAHDDDGCTIGWQEGLSPKDEDGCPCRVRDHRLHALTRGRAADLDREVWAELAP